MDGWAARLLPVLPSLFLPPRLRFEPLSMLSAGSLTVSPLRPVLEPCCSGWPGMPSNCPEPAAARSWPLLDPPRAELPPSPVRVGSRDEVRGGAASGGESAVRPAKKGGLVSWWKECRWARHPSSDDSQSTPSTRPGPGLTLSRRYGCGLRARRTHLVRSMAPGGHVCVAGSRWRGVRSAEWVWSDGRGVEAQLMGGRVGRGARGMEAEWRGMVWQGRRRGRVRQAGL